MSNLKFSIIIPVRNINDFLRENIKNLKKLDYPNFEVIILLDEEEGFDFSDNRFQIIATGPKGPGEKRNIGVENSAGDVVVFLDDDAYPKKDWLSKASEIFKDPEVYALGAPAVTPLDAPFLERMGGRVHESFLTSGNIRYRHVPSDRRYVDDYPTVNLFVRKGDFEKIGGFITEFWPGEDTKLCLDLVKLHGRKFLYSPEPIVYHHRRNLFLPHLKQLSRYGQHRGQFAKIFPETSLIPSYFVPSLFLIGLIIGPIVSTFFPFLWMFYFSVIFIYLFLVLWESFKVILKERNILAGAYVFIGIFLTHLVYGANIIIGLIKKPKLKLRDVDEKGNYLGG